MKRASFPIPDNTRLDTVDRVDEKLLRSPLGSENCIFYRAVKRIPTPPPCRANLFALKFTRNMSEYDDKKNDSRLQQLINFVSFLFQVILSNKNCCYSSGMKTKSVGLPIYDRVLFVYLMFITYVYNSSNSTIKTDRQKVYQKNEQINCIREYCERVD